jgi:purine-nucleoside/S-methyl-5'-thioadenosine phosphorylase / adenosine deaminase
MIAISTDRYGGLSSSPYHSLNLSYGVGDNNLSVTENRERLKRNYLIPHLLSARQVHGDAIFLLEEQLYKNLEVESFDALVTDQKGVGLLIQQADCQAITLFDPEHSAIAAIHNGWQGSVQNIIAKTVALLSERYGSSPLQIQAQISPSLGPCCAEFIHHALEFPVSFLPCQETKNHFNFWKISSMQLVEAGLQEKNIKISGICTSCSSDYFSYRRACRKGDGVTGRCATLISL